jgi:Flp pilus assembly pilin Flp
MAGDVAAAATCAGTRLGRSGPAGLARRPIVDVAERNRALGERGQGLAEYALILAFIAIVTILALLFIGGQVSKILSDVGHSV